MATLKENSGYLYKPNTANANAPSLSGQFLNEKGETMNIAIFKNTGKTGDTYYSFKITPKQEFSRKENTQSSQGQNLQQRREPAHSINPDDDLPF